MLAQYELSNTHRHSVRPRWTVTVFLLSAVLILQTWTVTEPGFVEGGRRVAEGGWVWRSMGVWGYVPPQEKK